VSIEVVEAVVEALQGKLSANAVNAPMVAPEVLRELAPYVTLAEGLGKVRCCAGPQVGTRWSCTFC
jgi:D-3-phosphoglycerate dehydrogenase